MSTTVYISIGNSDDKLTQNEWAHFWTTVDRRIRSYAHVVHGSWVSEATSPWQNACWCIEVQPDHTKGLRIVLGQAAQAYQQDSIAWAEATTEFIAPEGAFSA